MTPPRRLVIDADKLRRLVAGDTLAYAVGEQRLEIVLALSNVGWKQVFHAVVDALPSAAILSDPPQAREFLPVSSQPRRRK
jgi:hypothetical protein